MWYNTQVDFMSLSFRGVIEPGSSFLQWRAELLKRSQFLKSQTYPVYKSKKKKKRFKIIGCQIGLVNLGQSTKKLRTPLHSADERRTIDSVPLLHIRLATSKEILLDQFRYIKIHTWLPGLGIREKKSWFILFLRSLGANGQVWILIYRKWSFQLLLVDS